MIEIQSISGSFTKVDSDSRYHYIVGTEGVVIFEATSAREVAFASISGIKDVSVGQSRVYLATSSGVLYFNKKESWNLQDFQDDVYFHSTVPDLPTNDVLTIDNLNDNFLLIGTVSGVTLASGGQYFNSSEFSPVTSVAISPDEALYYGGSFGLAAKRTTVTGTWTADYLLNPSTIPPMFPVNSIDITLDQGQRVVGVGTSAGVMIIKEEDIVGNSNIIQLLT